MMGPSSAEVTCSCPISSVAPIIFSARFCMALREYAVPHTALEAIARLHWSVQADLRVLEDGKDRPHALRHL